MKSGVIGTVCVFGIALMLVACSSGGDGGGGTAPVAPVASAPPLTGTFVDAPVAGLPYATSSGLSGVTDSQGRFNYRAGNTVTFSYGQTIIGSVPTARQITPWTVFGLKTPDPADPRWVNLGRIVQTLNNQLPPVTPAIAALPPINFNQADADFAADPNVANLLTAMGSNPAALVSAAQAIATMQREFAILGSWSAQNTSGPNFIVFTAMADGTFMLSEDGSTDLNGQDGMERGAYTWDRATGTFPATVQVDTNGQNGISHTNPPLTATVSGNENTLTITETGGTPVVLTRVVDITPPIDPFVGVWRFDDTDGPGTLTVLTLFENGIFVLVSDETAPVNDGIERGTYSVAQNGDATLTRILDTNGDAGIFDPASPGPVVVNAVVNGDTMTVNDGEGGIFTGTRIRAPQ